MQSRRVTVRCPICTTLNRVDLARLPDSPKCGECGRPILLDRPLRATDQDLGPVVQEAEVPVVVDFYADWCAPCKVMAPIFDELAREYMGRVLFTKLDTDQNPAMARQHGVRGIPTMIIFRSGREAARQVGVIPKPQLKQMLDSEVEALAAEG